MDGTIGFSVSNRSINHLDRLDRETFKGRGAEWLVYVNGTEIFVGAQTQFSGNTVLSFGSSDRISAPVQAQFCRLSRQACGATTLRPSSVPTERRFILCGSAAVERVPSFAFHRLHTAVSNLLLNYLRGDWRFLSPFPSTLFL